MKQLRYDQVYMEIAYAVSKLSHDEKTKVGSIIVKNGQIISQGWNGMPAGFPNEMRTDGVTNKEVLHSESNALAKLTKVGGGSDGATIYCTHSPCLDCAKLLLQAGIKEVVYDNEYCLDSLIFMVENLRLRKVQHDTRECDRVFDWEGFKSKCK